LKERGWLSEEECGAALDALFPGGFAGPDVLREIAHGGWAKSQLARVFHPTVEQVFEERLALHKNLDSFRRKDGGQPTAREPTIDGVRAEWKETPVEPDRELESLVGLCVWDIFSENHDVVAPDGRLMHLGSWRAAGEFIAGYLDRRTGSERYNYMDFYMGTSLVSHRADLRPVYAMLFRRFNAAGFDWEYSFPRLHVVDLRPQREELDEGKPRAAEWVAYDPSEAMAVEAEDREQDAEHARIEDDLDRLYRESVEEAKSRPPPATVEAYRSVFGRFPRGWPP
jgi:hypothetical protein